MFCPNCGTKNYEDAHSCVNCNAPLNNFSSNGAYVDDKPNVIVNILSLCCFPLLGIILYFVWKNKQPKAAKSALMFALIGIGISVVFGIISFLLGLNDDSLYY